MHRVPTGWLQLQGISAAGKRGCRIPSRTLDSKLLKHWSWYSNTEGPCISWALDDLLWVLLNAHLRSKGLVDLELPPACYDIKVAAPVLK